MEAAAKTPMIKPPITKTNVLKMDNNFKGAVALYDYIISYTKPGYIAEEQKVDLAPFRDELADELSEALGMLTFLMYENGLGIKPMLKERFEEEEHRRELERIERRNEKLETLRRKIKNSGESPEEYVLEMEKQIKSLENENSRIDGLLKEIAELTSAKESLDSQIVKLREDMELAIRERDEKAEKYLREIDTVKEEMNQRIHDNLVKYEEEARALEKECNDIIEANNSQMKEVREQCKRDVDAADEERKKAEEKYEELSAAHEKLTEEKTLCEARLKGVRAQHGLMTDDDDYTEEDTFSILEKEHEAFERFYNSQWDKTKKKIRKSILNMENLTGRKRHK
jgi:chromosome segregation ATPase